MTAKTADCEPVLVGVTYLVVAISLAGCGRVGFDAADAAGFDDGLALNVA